MGQRIRAIVAGFAERKHLHQRGNLGALADARREAVAGEAGQVLLAAEPGGEQGEVGASLQLIR
jgi:hypothetical protein